MTQNQNPLQKHFRRPAIYIKLPSNGSFWPDGSLDLPVTGEIPVLPMTTKDEITIRTPDALLNGAGVVDVIQSCIPNIKDAWKMPSTDVDAVLVAIRIASYSPMMDVDSKCPHCEAENTYSVNLNDIVSSIKFPAFDQPLVVDGLTFKFKPQQFFDANKTNLVNFEEQKLLSTVSDADIEEEERSQRFIAHLTRLVDLNVQVFVDSTAHIQTEDGTIVSDQIFIKEFYSNADRKIIAEVKNFIEQINESIKIKPVSVTCGDCAKPFDINVIFDYAHFFA